MKKMTFNRRRAVLTLLVVLLVSSVIMVFLSYPQRKKAPRVALPKFYYQGSSSLGKSLKDLNALLMLQTRLECILSNDSLGKDDSLEIQKISIELDKLQQTP